MFTADENRVRMERAGIAVLELSRHTPVGTFWGAFGRLDGKFAWGLGASREEAWQAALRDAEALGLLRRG